jgi:hypothetical protein
MMPPPPARSDLPIAAVAVALLLALSTPAVLEWFRSPSTVGRAGSLEPPPPPAPAFIVPKPLPLERSSTESVWAPVERAVAVRARPSDGAPIVARLSTRTPEGTANIVSVVDRRADASGRLWVRARLPILPNGSTGWLPRASLGGYRWLDTELVIELRRRRATLVRGRRTLFQAPVAIGRPEWPTPTGHFYIRNKLTRYASPSYGPVAFGTSARSSVLTDWPAGGYIGIHGTDQPQLVPGQVSHGCVRLRNSDILTLAQLMPVGTPVTIRA